MAGAAGVQLCIGGLSEGLTESQPGATLGKLGESMSDDEPVRRIPSLDDFTRGEREAMESWAIDKFGFDSVVEATDGCRVEPDGICPHGHLSWLRFLGLV